MSPQSAPATATSPVSARPPVAAKIPSERTFHGDTFVDEFAWLADKENPETISYLEAQNSYADELNAGQAALRTEIFDEIKARTQETDLTVPARRGDWWYYTRTETGQQYSLYCRTAAKPGDTRPPMNDDGGPLDGEQVLLDGNELAAGQEFFSMGTFAVSPDGALLAYSTDFEGNERFTMRVKDLATGQDAPDEIPGAFYGGAWSADNTAFFYTTVDEAWRPHRVWRHMIGTPAASDVVVYEDPDERFWVDVELSRSRAYLVISSGSKLTSDARLLDAANPAGEFTLVAPRRHGVRYQVEHQVTADGTDRLLILHNDGAENFELAQAPITDTTAWTPVLRHRGDTRLAHVEAFADHIVVYLRRDGLTALRVLGGDGTDYEIKFPEPLYRVAPANNLEYHASSYRLNYVSMITPDSVYDCETATGELTLLRQRPVLPSPDGKEYDPADYRQVREWATAADGTKIPVSLVWHADTPKDGTAPVVLYGYGSYELPMDPSFATPRLSLLDRGFVYAIAHIRGGGEMGRYWYDQGKMLHKINTFTDFVACARHLVQENWTTSKRIIARGGSAGGLLVGAAVNIAPDAFGAVVAQVPFVDALTSILDPSLPLTVTEWEEWGDPLHDPEVYRYMKSYSPYENISADVAYPPIFAITSLNDTRVLYREPAKWIAKLQATARGGPFLLKTEMIAGHGGRSGRYDKWHEEAMVLAWIVSTAEAG